jgi:hypothetical protein
MMRFVLVLATATLYVLHQDFWLWRVSEPLVFGFLPPGLAYHAGFTLAAALLMVAWVKFCWPSDLGDDGQ